MQGTAIWLKLLLFRSCLRISFKRFCNPPSLTVFFSSLINPVNLDSNIESFWLSIFPVNFKFVGHVAHFFFYVYRHFWFLCISARFHNFYFRSSFSYEIFTHLVPFLLSSSALGLLPNVKLSSEFLVRWTRAFKSCHLPWQSTSSRVHIIFFNRNGYWKRRNLILVAVFPVECRVNFSSKLLRKQRNFTVASNDERELNVTQNANKIQIITREETKREKGKKNRVKSKTRATGEEPVLGIFRTSWLKFKQVTRTTSTNFFYLKVNKQQNSLAGEEGLSRFTWSFVKGRERMKRELSKRSTSRRGLSVPSITRGRKQQSKWRQKQEAATKKKKK